MTANNVRPQGQARSTSLSMTAHKANHKKHKEALSMTAHKAGHKET
jgi:hypothetical protein